MKLHVKPLNVSSRLNRDFSPVGQYLVAVSGGRDSVALLHWLIEAGYKNLLVCHLNHQLRGRSSHADARFVQKLTAKYDLNSQFTSANVRALAKKNKMSIETAAREARYSFFATVAKRHRCHTIFLAHHADDLVETFLLNLFRGAGLSGLVAMREVCTRCIDDVDLTIVRPFLSIWRAEIDSYVRAHGLKFREDASNKKPGPLRNRIRRTVIPYLEKTVGRNIRKSIWRTAIIAAEEENWLEHQLPETGRLRDLSVKKLRELPVALQRRAILNWLRGQNVSDVGFEAIERVRSLLDPRARVAKVNLAKDRHARRRAGKIFVE